MTLTVGREGELEPLTIVLQRYRITIPMVESEILDSGVAYVKINQFGDGLSSTLRDHLRDVLRQDPRGLIVDLRNNPGGLLDAAVEISDMSSLGVSHDGCSFASLYKWNSLTGGGYPENNKGLARPGKGVKNQELFLF